ncbi:MAG: hypothetical protein Q8K43_08715 [Sulfurimicrobium sp.]|nr:hypothetical protein [Sulfurimicrobium sp.]
MANRNESSFGTRFEKSLKELERTRTLRPVRNVLLFSSYALLAVAVVLLISRGNKNIVVYVALTSMLSGVLVAAIDTYISKVYKRGEVIKNELEIAEAASKIEENTKNTSGKIPLTVGFLNLDGEHLDRIILEDASKMSGIFLRTVFARKEQSPESEILFIYANLDEAGSFENNRSESVRQIAQKSNASIVILASPNDSDRIKAAVNFPGPKTSNIVFTIDRKGAAFGQFFKTLFQNMRGGEDMLSSWVALAPQGPQSSSANVPVTILVAEAGKLAFPT